MSEVRVQYSVDRYKPLGLLGNPFALTDSAHEFGGIDLEVGSESNALLGAIVAAADEPTPKPVLIIKSETMPAYYHMRAMGRTEHSLATDESLEVLHAYVPMFMLRLGRVRAALGVVAERIAFRQFDQTLALYIEEVLGATDETLASFQVLGAERLGAFAERFRANPLETTTEVFGQAIVERRTELIEVADIRSADLISDVEEEETSVEIDNTIRDAPGSEEALMEEAETEVEDPDQAVVDYIVEYAKMHLSPVIARGLRMYKRRGLMALTTEFTITKAPRKTLAALVKFARTRFKKIILIWDGFDGWVQVPAETRLQIASTISELRWMLETDALTIVVLEEDGEPELEEQFGSGKRIQWSFSGVPVLEKNADLLDRDMIDGWLRNAAYPGAPVLSMDDPILAALATASDDSLKAFGLKAATAIESAADRGAASLDDEALRVGLAAVRSEVEEQ